MIGLRQTIERGMRHRWLGPLFVILFVLMLVLLFMHAMHDGHEGLDVGMFCLGLTIMFGLIVLIRLRWRVVISAAVARPGRAPPVLRMLPLQAAAPCVTPPLRL